MSYKPDTILTLKEPRSTPEKPFAYDRVRVVGISPMNHGVRSGEWGNDGGEGIIIQPVGEHFGANLDEPFGKLQHLYDVEFIPEPAKIMRGVPIETYEPGPSPEQVFAEEASKKPATRRAAKDG